MNAQLSNSDRLTDPGLGIDAATAAALESGRLTDPFAVLGPHADARGTVVRTFAPPAERIELIGPNDELLAIMQPTGPAGLFVGRIDPQRGYRFRIRWPGGLTQITEDPYSFGLLLGELDVYLLAEGNHLELGRCLGAQAMTHRRRAPACASPSGRRMRSASRWSATSMAGTVVATRCASASRPACGNCSSRGCRSARIYKYEILGPHGTAAAQGRSGGPAGRGAAAHGLGRRRPDAIHVER